MSANERGGEIRLDIGSIVVPPSLGVDDLAERIEREIADRRFGPGSDPVVAQIATRLYGAIESTEDAR